jgi:hypothetical protein
MVYQQIVNTTPDANDKIMCTQTDTKVQLSDLCEARACRVIEVNAWKKRRTGITAGDRIPLRTIRSGPRWGTKNKSVMSPQNSRPQRTWDRLSGECVPMGTECCKVRGEVLDRSLVIFGVPMNSVVTS